MNVTVGYVSDDTEHKLFITTLDKPITLTKCNTIVSIIEQTLAKKPDFLRIFLCDRDWFLSTAKKIEYENGNSMPPYSTKEAIFDVKRNCLQIFDDDLPIYENNNGTICNDIDSLCDCLM